MVFFIIIFLFFIVKGLFQRGGYLEDRVRPSPILVDSFRLLTYK